MKNLLDNIVWHTLTGPHQKYADGTNEARRYASGFSPIVGFADVQNPNLDDLLPYCTPGEHFYCGDWNGPCKDHWQIEEESTMFRMVWESAIPTVDETFKFARLAPEHASQALELATLTRPGPFGPRTIELGEYIGCFEGERLVSMAGERLHVDNLREISGVCTHPDFQGRGFGRRLISELVRRQLERNEKPFLHVMRENTRAHDLYMRMGFRDFREVTVRVISLS